MVILLKNAAKYFEGYDHQVAALDWLQNQIPDNVLKEFGAMFTPQESKVDPTDKFLINWNDMNDKVSKYFTVREVTNNDKRRIPQSDRIKRNIVELAEELDIVREKWGSGIVVTSWYRPPDVNREIGGAKYSQHIEGLAADIKPAKGNIYVFQTWLDKGLWKNRALGYGAKRGFVHVDLRQGRIRWDY